MARLVRLPSTICWNINFRSSITKHLIKLLKAMLPFNLFFLQKRKGILKVLSHLWFYVRRQIQNDCLSTYTEHIIQVMLKFVQSLIAASDQWQIIAHSFSGLPKVISVKICIAAIFRCDRPYSVATNPNSPSLFSISATSAHSFSGLLKVKISVKICIAAMSRCDHHSSVATNPNSPSLLGYFSNQITRTE